jgi:hypothetical protein
MVSRINERWTPFSSLLHYLHKCHQRYENLDPALSFEHHSKSAIVNAIVQLNEWVNQRTDEPLSSTRVSSDSDSLARTANLSWQFWMVRSVKIRDYWTFRKIYQIKLIIFSKIHNTSYFFKIYKTNFHLISRLAAQYNQKAAPDKNW